MSPFIEVLGSKSTPSLAKQRKHRSYFEIFREIEAKNGSKLTLE
jgi:hypothetical protein